MFGITYKNDSYGTSVVELPLDSKPLVIEGAAVVHTLAPINPQTGRHEDLGSALRSAIHDPKLSSLVAPLLAELPAIRSDPRLSDSDREDMIISRFNIGTPAENEQAIDAINQFMDVLLPSRRSADEVNTPAPAEGPAAAPVEGPAANT